MSGLDRLGLFFITDTWMHEGECVADAISLNSACTADYAEHIWNGSLLGRSIQVVYGIYLQDAGTYVDNEGNRIHLSAGRVYDLYSDELLIERAASRTLIYLKPGVSPHECPAFIGTEVSWQPCKFRVILRLSVETIAEFPDFIASLGRRKILQAKWAEYNFARGLGPLGPPQWKEDLERAEKIRPGAAQRYPAILESGGRNTHVVMELIREVETSVWEAMLHCADLPAEPVDGAWLKRTAEWNDEGARGQPASQGIAEILTAQTPRCG
jgi:hypothetical protein